MIWSAGKKKYMEHQDADICGAKLYVQKEGVIICGKPKEVRRLLKNCSSKYRTVKELITSNLN